MDQEGQLRSIKANLKIENIVENSRQYGWDRQAGKSFFIALENRTEKTLHEVNNGYILSQTFPSVGMATRAEMGMDNRQPITP